MTSNNLDVVDTKREATSAYNAQYYHDNKDTLLASQREYYMNNREKKRKRMSEYYQENKATLVASKKQYCIDNRETIRVRMKEYYDKRRDVVLVEKKAYYAKHKDHLRRPWTCEWCDKTVQHSSKYAHMKTCKCRPSSLNQTISPPPVAPPQPL